jgi:dTDP-4-dehydrorhamnose 3,5-epimerase
MRFKTTRLPGVFQVELELRGDDRGFLARTYCDHAFAAQGLNTRWPQCNLTLTRPRGTIRGMHFQAEPKPEIKLIRCVGGVIFDVLVDVRPDSPTFGQWQGFELSSANRMALYVPTGIAHGMQCLVENCEVYYHMSESYVPELARGIRWNDPAVGIQWPLPNPTLSERDARLPTLLESAQQPTGFM